MNQLRTSAGIKDKQALQHNLFPCSQMWRTSGNFTQYFPLKEQNRDQRLQRQSACALVHAPLQQKANQTQTWQLGERRSHNLIVLSREPDRNVSSIGDMFSVTTLQANCEENAPATFKWELLAFLSCDSDRFNHEINWKWKLTSLCVPESTGCICCRVRINIVSYLKENDDIAEWRDFSTNTSTRRNSREVLTNLTEKAKPVHKCCISVILCKRDIFPKAWKTGMLFFSSHPCSNVLPTPCGQVTALSRSVRSATTVGLVTLAMLMASQIDCREGLP